MNMKSHNLDHYFNLVYRTIIQHQNPITGLLPAHQIAGCEDHAWIRDNVYSIMSVWSLSMAYKHKSDSQEDQTRSFLLEKSTVKCMRGLLTSMMGQRDKVERFKKSLSDKDALHAKYCSKTGIPVVNDDQWGHLQIDAVSLYLLILAQMTASGLQIIFTLDEVAFIQNLVFYIETAYITPDYGVWERGAKSNQGIRELNASSIGMAKAALEAMNKLDLFGSNGSPLSVIHTLPDEVARCSAVLDSMLPRESNSKETDSAILAIVGFPAFAVSNPKRIENTVETIQNKLGGRYGLKRFLRDGYKTLKEDTKRLHYEPWELRVFDNIECEWPLFYCYLALLNIFNDNTDIASEYCQLLDQLTVASNGLKLIPELYMVTADNMTQELSAPGTTDRSPGGRCPFMWAQSLFVISKLLLDDYLAPGELDPLNRRLSSIRKPDVVVQVVVLAEDKHIQDLLKDQGILLETVDDISPIVVKPAAMLSRLISFLGKSHKLGLSGRNNSDVGILTTSKIFKIQDKTFVFTPQSFDRMVNYIDSDPSLAMSTLAYGLNYLSTTWTDPGRPTITLILNQAMVEDGRIPQPFVTTLRKLRSGYINGTRVILGSHSQFRPTSCISELAFLVDAENGEPDKLRPEVVKYLEAQLGSGSVKGGVLGKGGDKRRNSGTSGVSIVPMTGTMKRSRSICPDQTLVREIQKNISASEAAFSVLMDSDSDSMKSISRQSSIAEEKVFLAPTPSQTVSSRRTRFESEVQYFDTEIEDLVDMLRSTNDMEIHGDILHYMVCTYGMMHKTNIGVVKDLIRELYESACVAKNWSIVRHSHGLLGKKMQNMDLSVTDLIVRQKQVTVGLPPDNEVIISQPLSCRELQELIASASMNDPSAASLTQEVLCYLGMFVRTEPKLFYGMLRLRVGLILQVMTSEIRRSLNISDAEAEEKLLGMSPYETKNLLHHIMSGQEYDISQTGSKVVILSNSYKISQAGASSHPLGGENERKGSIFQHQASVCMDDKSSNNSQSPRFGSQTSLNLDADDEIQRTGMWVRRRLLDGSLNRVPPEFYTRMWTLLLKCQGICVNGNTLYQTITQEMTSGEMKFHLRCEALLNCVPEPGFRQLIVEAILILILCVENDVVQFLGSIINVDDIVREANKIFLDDMNQQGGLCCSLKPGACGGEMGVCLQFYDSAPSGPYGTMSFLVRGTCSVINTIPAEGDIDCNIM